MSVAIMTEVWRMDLSTTDKMVLLALADAANDDGVTWIAVSSRRAGEKLDLLKKTSLSERAIQGAIKRLTAAGHLQRTERPGKGVIYQINPRSSCAPTPAPAAPRSICTPAANDVDPRSSCGETVSNRQLVVAAATRARPAKKADDDWPSDDLAELADLLVGEAHTHRLDPAREIGLSTTLEALRGWRQAGVSWNDVVVPVVAIVSRQEGGPIRSWRYFDAQITEAAACFTEPLPIPPARAEGDR